MKKYGYARVSTVGQNIDAQKEQLMAAEVDTIYFDHATGTTNNRPQLNELIEQLKSGDQVVITKLDRIARSTLNALSLIKQLEDKGVSLVVLNMNGDKLDTSTANGKLMVTMLSAIAEFEIAISKERQREGIELAKQRGAYKGRPKKYTRNNKALQHAIELFNNREENKMTVQDICSVTGISRTTLYRNV